MKEVQEHTGKQLAGPGGAAEGVKQEMPFGLYLEEGRGVRRTRKGEDRRHSTWKGTEA